MSGSENDRLDVTGAGISGGNFDGDVKPIVTAAGKNNNSTFNQPEANARQSQSILNKYFISIGEPRNDQSRPEPPDRASSGPQTYKPSFNAWLIGRYGAGPGAWTPEEAFIHLPNALEEWDNCRKELRIQEALVYELTQAIDELRASHNNEVEAIKKSGAAELRAKDAIITSYKAKLADFEERIEPDRERLQIEVTQLRCELQKYQDGVGARSDPSHKDEDPIQKEIRTLGNEIENLENEVEQLRTQDEADEAELGMLEQRIDEEMRRTGGEEDMPEHLKTLCDRQDEITRCRRKRKFCINGKTEKTKTLKQRRDNLHAKVDNSNFNSGRRESDSSRSSNQGLTDGCSVAESDQSSPPPTISMPTLQPDKTAGPVKQLTKRQGLVLSSVAEESYR